MLVLEAAAAARFDRVAFSPDSRRVAAGCWDGVYAWNLDAPDERTFVPASGVNCVGYLPDGRLFVGACQFGIHVQRPNDGRFVRNVATLRSRYVVTSPGSPLIVQTDMDVHNPKLRCFRPAENNLPRRWEVDRDVPHAPAILPDGQTFVVPYSWIDDGKGGTAPAPGVRFYSLTDGREVEDVRLSDSLPHLIVAPDGGWFVSPFENHVRYWHRGQTDGEVRRIVNDSREHICGVAFHPSGRYLAATSNDATVKFYDTATWRLERTFTWNIGRMRGVAFSPDGTLAAAGGDSGRVVVWDVDP